MSVLWPFIAIGVLALADFLLARSWSRVYFTFGLPIFRMRLDGVRLGPDAEQRLATVAERNASLILFQRLSESEIALREKGRANVSFRYMPVMHGLLRYAPEEGATYVIGWINLWALAIVAFFTYLFIDAPHYRKPIELTLWAAAIYGVMYAIGVWRFRMVAKALRVTDAGTSPQSLPVR
jgi:hypothetical protein